MTLVGKIFVVAILVMSVVYMGFAMAVYSAHTNWYDEIYRDQATAGKDLGLKHQIDNLKKQKEELQLEWEALEKEKATLESSHAQQLGKLENERDGLLKERKVLQARHDQLMNENRSLSSAVDTVTQDLRRLTDEVVVLRGKITKVQQARDQIFTDVVAKTDQLHNLQGQLAILKEREAQLTQQLAQYRTTLRAHGLNPAEAVASFTPDIMGVVTAVRRNEFVEISIGADDGVKPGQTLEVFRASSYLGRVEVLRSAPDRAVAKVLKEFRRGEIQKGDRVATKLRVG